MKNINMDVTDIFRQTVFKLVNSDNYNIDLNDEERFSTVNESFERFSKSVSQSFCDKLQENFYEALLDEIQKHES